MLKIHDRGDSVKPITAVQYFFYAHDSFNMFNRRSYEL